ncbi:unnamed protein product [Malus baccata var. baccata]
MLEQVLSDQDSEDEVDDDVADLEDRRMLDDFVDVTKDEKKMMHMWNSFVRKQQVLADGHILWGCEAILRLHGQDLVKYPALIWLMEASLATVALTVVLVSIVAWAWSLLNWVWFRPKKLERYLRQQGLAGNSYRLLFGDLKESSMMHKQARSKPINHLSHDIVPHILPFLHQTVITYGKNSFIWMGPTLRVNILNPEDLRDVLNRYDDFRKPLSNPITKFMVPTFYQSCSEMIDTWENLMANEGLFELDVWPWLQSLAGDVISRAAFGSSYEEGKKIFQLLKEQARIGATLLRSATSVYIPGWR